MTECSPQQFKAHYVWCHEDLRQKTLERQCEFYEQHPDKRIARKARFIKARNHPISAFLYRTHFCHLDRDMESDRDWEVLIEQMLKKSQSLLQ